MSWINQLFDWNNQGTDPSESLKTNGFKGGMRPPASVFNAFWYKVIKAIKELQDNVEKGANKTTVDSALSSTSTNPVQNKVINTALSGKANSSHTHDDRYYTETEINTKLGSYLPKSGGTMTGALTLNGAPAADLQAATKKYVDNLAPLLIDTTDITSATTMNSTIDKITASFQIRDVILCENSTTARCYNVCSFDTSGVTFACIENGKIRIAQLLYDTAAISYDTMDLSTKLRTVTLSSTGWTESGSVYTQAATVSGVSATETAQEIHVTPAIANMSAYMGSGIYVSEQAVNKITFTAGSKPTSNITVYVVIRAI